MEKAADGYRGPEIILASGSPRRKELMEMLVGDGFKVLPAKGEEIKLPGRGPEETVKALSRAKAREVAAGRPDTDVIIAADTVVWAGGRMMGKPADEKDAADMLRELSGKTHTVYSGVTVIFGNTEICEAERTDVSFRELSEEEITAYVSTGEPMDKAGAYAAQGIASLFVEKMDGDFFNVMGLPVYRLGRMLGELGVRLI